MGDEPTIEEIRALIIWLRKSNRGLTLADEAAECLEAMIASNEALRAKVAALEARLAWKAGDPGATHYEGCWRDHYECAMAKIGALGAEKAHILNAYPRTVLPANGEVLAVAKVTP